MNRHPSPRNGTRPLRLHCSPHFYPTAGDRLGWVTLCVLALLCTIGCEQPDPIITYKIPTTVPDQLKPGKQRMLAAMLPRKTKVWFFKVTGPEKAIESIETEFRNFVKATEFKGESPDLSKLPGGWRRGGEKPMRYASIDIETKLKQLDLSVSSLPRPEESVSEDDWGQYVDLNVNRWRGQLGLDTSNEKWAGAKPIQIASADGESVWVDLVGDSVNTSMSPPFAGGAGSMAKRAAPPSSASNGSPKDRLKFDRPDGWRDGRMSMMRWAAFNVGPEDAAAEITVMPAGGDLRGNVERWIGQVQGKPADEAALTKALDESEELVVDGKPGLRFLLTGDDDAETAIDATIVPISADVNMFIKMTGPPDTVKSQRESLSQFLKSLEF